MCTGGDWGCVEGFFWGSGSAGGTQRGPGGSGVSPGRRWGRHFRGSQGKEGGRCFIGSQGCGGGLKAGSEDTGISGSGGEALWVWGVSGLTWARRKKCGRCFMALPRTQATLPKRPGCAARSARIRARVNAATLPRSSSPSASVCGKRSASATAGTAGETPGTSSAPPGPPPSPGNPHPPPNPSVPPVLTQQPPVAAPHVCELHAGRGGPGGGVGRKKGREQRGPVHVLRAGGAAGTARLLLTGNRRGHRGLAPPHREGHGGDTRGGWGGR